MPYHIVTATDKAELEKEVERFRNMNWRCQGGIAFCLYPAYEADGFPRQDALWAQAMVKEAPKATVSYPTKVPAYQELYPE